MTDAHDNALIRHEHNLECRGCGSITGHHHAPECSCVDAFEAGRIPEQEEG